MLITKRDLGLIPCFYAEEKMVVYMGELKVLIFLFLHSPSWQFVSQGMMFRPPSGVMSGYGKFSSSDPMQTNPVGTNSCNRWI